MKISREHYDRLQVNALHEVIVATVLDQLAGELRAGGHHEAAGIADARSREHVERSDRVAAYAETAPAASTPHRLLRCINEACDQFAVQHVITPTPEGPFLTWPLVLCRCGQEPAILSEGEADDD